MEVKNKFFLYFEFLLDFIAINRRYISENNAALKLVSDLASL